MLFTDDPSRIAEDDRHRSHHVWTLVQGTPLTDAPSGTNHIPRVIVQFWDDSRAIPSDVSECLDSWEPLAERGFTRVLFDDHAARRFISSRLGAPHVEAFDRCRHPAMRCDYFRLCYISQCGGFYIDADDVYQGGDCESLFRDGRLKLQPLCYDTLRATMISPDEFMRSRKHSTDRIYYVNNNPLIAPARHPVIQLALARSTRILMTRDEGRLDIHATTGPENLTASLVRHSIALARAGKPADFRLLTDWDAIAISRWPLSYRDDERNWRLWDPTA